MSYVFKASDVFDFANSIRAEYFQKGSELFFKRCPKCGGGGHDKNTFSVNLESGVFKCFRASCDYHGHFVELARDFNYPLEFGTPKTYRKLPQRKIETKPFAVEYMESRGIGKEITERYKITVRKDNPSVLVFPFYDENNVLQFIKYRNTKAGAKGGKEWCEQNTKPILFGMAQCKGFDRLIITEGQIDSMTVAQCGFDNAVSVPTGALGFTWLTNCWDWITQFKEVVVFGDFEKGKITLLDTLQARLPQKVKAVRKGDYLGEKDANAILTKYGLDAVRTAVNNAEVPMLSNVKDLSTVAAVDVNKLPKIFTNIREIDRIIGGLVFGQLVVLTGKRGEGKSTFMSQLVAEALDQDQSVFVYSGELADFHFRRWLDYQLAGAQNVDAFENAYGDMEYAMSESVADRIGAWYKGRAYIYDNSYVPDSGSEFESLPKTIEKVVKQFGVSLVCIDNLMTAMDTVTQNDNLNLAQGNFVTELKRIAVKYNIVIVLVAHPRKSSGDFSNDDVSGSADITNRADVVLSYRRADRDGEGGGFLTISKNRLKGTLAMGENSVPLLYSAKTKRIFSETSRPRKYGWEIESFDSDDDLDFI